MSIKNVRGDLEAWAYEYRCMKYKNYAVVFVQLIIVGWLAPSGTLAKDSPTRYPLVLDYALPTSYLIQDIRVTGVQSLEEEAIKAISGLKSGDVIAIPGLAIAEAMQRLWRQKLIQDVAVYGHKIMDNRVVLTLQITECPRLSDYTFEGIPQKEQKKLIDKLPLVRGKIITDAIISVAQKTIQNYYMQGGYPHTTVSATTLSDPVLPGHVRLKIVVDKGKECRINSVNFSGNRRVSSQTLRRQMKNTRGKSRFTLVRDLSRKILMLQLLSKGGALWRPFSLKDSWAYLREHVVLTSSKFNTASLAEDRKRIIQYYQSQGFGDATVVENVTVGAEDNWLDVWLKIEEGTQYRMGNIRWTGNYLYSAQNLNRLLNIQTGDPYDPWSIQQGLHRDQTGRDVASLYADNGHAFFQASVAEVGLREDTVDIEICVKEGPRGHVGKVWIAGNKLTMDHVIRREIRSFPGDKFNKTRLQRSYRELMQLSLFDPAAIDIVPTPDYLKKTIDITCEVKEKPKFEVRVSGGWGDGGLVGVGALSVNNFSLGNLWKGRRPLGGGQTMGIKAERDSTGYNNFVLDFMDPWLGSRKPIYFQLSLNRAYAEKNSTLGGGVNLGARLPWLDNSVLLRWGVAYHYHRYSDYDFLGNNKQRTGVLNDLHGNILLEYDSTGPDPVYPREGSKMGLQSRLTPPWSMWLHANQGSSAHSKTIAHDWKEYHQWMLDVSHFSSLLGDLVLNVRGHAGLVGKFSSQGSIGPFDRFYLGGTMPLEHAIRGKEHISLRGYKEDCIVPRDEVTGYKGGIIYDKLVIELRYPIISNYIAHVYALAFAEGGNTWAKYEDFDLLSMKRSIGVGLRFYLPFVLGTTLGFDWGYGFDREIVDKGNKKLEFHFSVGMGLR